MEIRQLRSEEATQAIKLSDAVFRDTEQKSMGEAFPTIFSSEMIEQSYGAFEGERLVAFMGLVPSVIRVGKAHVHSYSLGSVCTDPASRGKGYASQILDKLLRDIKQTEAALLLVSGDRPLYRRADCYPFGEVLQFEIEVAGSMDHTFAIREYSPRDVHRVTELANNRPVGYALTPYDMSVYIHAEAYASCIKQQHRVLLAEQQGSTQAFLIVGVPYRHSQSEAVAVEWGGDPQAIRSLLQAAKVHYALKSLKINVPWQEKELIERLSDFSHHYQANQGTIHLVDIERFFKQLGPYFSEAFPSAQVQDWQLDKGEKRIIIRRQGIDVEMTSEALVSYLFDPKARQEGLPSITIPLPYTAGLNYI
ncbi:hypothetical protein GCM10011391_16240 [Pullulanibacillus camelliae]|uniref:N-acetyltransferase domain-containing protein n=1 Tax=Pullulanibacillus camelliae TaxID=1707096 RepID=A0A8J2YGC6_9BACL|nr:GNAT family N-acetyltransferase [Pullulanibacillus camelliae]GGE38193.1 hypothetical protein GCM10011391_16240 [Pullulanibacillus camelliae]